MSGRPVVVGVDGSEQALAAVEWAARAAKGRPLRIVHAGSGPGVVEAAVELAMRVEPGAAVAGRTVPGGPADALLRQDADLVVVGSHSGAAGALLGSTALRVAADAACPVVVVRPVVDEPGPPESRGLVVAGVDGSAASAAVIEFAVAEAARLGTGVVGAMVAPVRPLRGTDVLLEEDEAPEHARLLAECLAGWPDKHPDVPVSRVLLAGRPARLLTGLALGARLLVVGSRGLGGVRGQLLGSTSQAVLKHAPCPVAVIH
ncbi:universal stress protein [Actinokineospora fastidiosa]|uniref:Universal stress protein n=1 Tax=Actinokineospora fastidiosa TaxID=1816 RepID=A0A918GCC6_9PSEU|nr:universal stress protein [Actinokineospora fastidiosa]GGS28661.1 universal stress protein [Actinokineospora fastidiosa]